MVLEEMSNNFSGVHFYSSGKQILKKKKKGNSKNVGSRRYCFSEMNVRKAEKERSETKNNPLVENIETDG